MELPERLFCAMGCDVIRRKMQDSSLYVLV
jgi:hypothetical protein